jgi:UDP-N-acetylmuramoyl-L-alanyl-D-glutamate--2,6-diaminopimelate ligase
VDQGSLFVAISGQKADGHRFLAQAFEKGAAAGVVENLPPNMEDKPLLVVPDTRKAWALFAGAVAGHPDRDMTLVGITGTNGKTTCAFLLAEIMSQAGQPTGLISTIGSRVGDRWEPAQRTTPEAPDLYRLLVDMNSSGCRSAVMEVSSHALELHRVYGLKFAVAAFTNLTQDHLDFHGDIESYFAAKARLFTEYNCGTAVINSDDPYGRRLVEMAQSPVITYGLDSEANIRGLNLRSSIEGLAMRVQTPRGDVQVQSGLTGRFNASNLLCVLGVVEALQLPQKAFLEAAETFRGAPGRMERFDLGGRWVYVDYAHTPDALHQVLKELRGLTRGALHVLFGCGGNRDRGKRPLMGQVAEGYADRIWITTDNPREEVPQVIAAEILGGITDLAKTVTILDRREAIHTALEGLPQGGILLIAGKGHEDYQEISGVKYPFDDRQEVRSYIEGSKLSQIPPAPLDKGGIIP